MHSRIFVPVLIILLLLPVSGTAADTAGSVFSTGQRYYSSGDYGQALDTFLQAVEMEPGNSVYHHWLAKTYGRLAEKAGIIKAYKLSKQTRMHLERAVELDNANIPALTDLMTYYRRAPGFLGGGEDKADAVCRRIRELRAGGAPAEAEVQSAGQDEC